MSHGVKFVDKPIVFKRYKSMIVHTPTLHTASTSTTGCKIAAFDLDSTLIRTKSGRRFARDYSDWTWWSECVKSRLLNLYYGGWVVVMFTNQAGIDHGRKKRKMIINKLTTILNELKISVPVFIATQSDKYRKPSTGMWRVFLRYYKIQAHLSSVFVGDAAGRGGDFSNSDLCFGLNCGLKFKTPEEFFLNKPQSYSPPPRPSMLLTQHADQSRAYPFPKQLDKPELVILMGPPASGKSTISRVVFGGYVHINRDKLGTRARCLALARKSLAEGSSIIVDNLNTKRSSRAAYIVLAKACGYAVRGFEVGTSRELANHLNIYRNKTTPTRRVPAVVYGVYYKYREPLHTNEGFDEVGKVYPVFKFSAQELKVFNEYT